MKTMTILEFLKNYLHLSARGSWYNLQSRGLTPPTVRVGRTVRVRVEDAEKWLAGRVGV